MYGPRPQNVSVTGAEERVVILIETMGGGGEEKRGEITVSSYARPSYKPLTKLLMIPVGIDTLSFAHFGILTRDILLGFFRAISSISST